MYAIGIAMLVVGILLSVIGMYLIVQARVPAPIENVATSEVATASEVTPVEDFEAPGTLVMVGEKVYQADTATVPGFMYTMWKANMIESGVIIKHEQDMGNGLMMVGALVPQEPGACGHDECQPGYEAPKDEDNGFGTYL